jgi:hypothetical protein
VQAVPQLAQLWHSLQLWQLLSNMTVIAQQDTAAFCMLVLAGLDRVIHAETPAIAVNTLMQG